MMFGSQVAAFEEQAQEHRTNNLQVIQTEVGRGFQALLIELAREVGCYISQAEMSNLCRGARSDKGQRLSAFDNYRARSIERALDLPRGSFDLPPWHFARALPVLWEYPTRAGSNREWFDSMLMLMLDVPSSPPEKPLSPRSAAMEAVLARLRARAVASS